ncbi:MAG: outer membrane protein assembly factor BamB [Mariniblastus sp.]|jgi:outer membrane protein assembly factor BamB
MSIQSVTICRRPYLKHAFWAVCCGLVLFSQPLLGQTKSEPWNQFRGPNGYGSVADASIPSEFGPNKNLIWKTELPNGFSSPVFHDDKMYLTAEENKELVTICYSKTDGHEVWRQVAPRNRTERLDPRNHPASSSPVVNEHGVFVFFPDYGMVAYDHQGTERWRQPLGPFNNIYGMGASPIAVDGLLVLVCDQNLNSFVIGMDQQSGETVWKTKREEATSGHCSPIVYQANPEASKEIIVAGSFNLTSYDLKSGKKNWWVGGLCFEMKSTPVVLGDTAFINGFGSPMNEVDQNYQVADFAEVVAEHDADKNGVLGGKEMPNELARNFFPAVDLDENKALNEDEWKYFQASIASKNSMMAIRLGGSGDMTLENTKWKYHKNIPQLPSPLLAGQQVLMVSDRGVLTSLDAETGKPYFKGRIPGCTGNFYASPVSAGDKVLIATTAGKIAVLQASAILADGELTVLAVNELEGDIYATPAIVDNQLFVRTTTTLYCFGEKK